MRTIKIFTNILLVVFGLSGSSGAIQQVQQENRPDLQSVRKSEKAKYSMKTVEVTLESLIAEAMSNNPKIHAVERKWESAKLRIPQEGSWMDPRLNINIMNFPISRFSFSAEPMTQKQISLMQIVPFPGITSLKEQIATEETDISGFTYSDTRNSVVNDVSLAYYDIYLIDKSIEITLKNKQLVDDFISIASKKYEVGEGLQQDVLKAHVEFSKMLDKLIMFRKRREGVVAILNKLLNRSTAIEIGELEDLKHIPVELDVQKLQNSAAATRPMLQAMQMKIEKNRSASELAKKQYWPNFSVGVAYSQRNDRRDFFTAQFSLNLPVWRNRKQDKKVEESLENILVAEKSFEDSKNAVDARIASLVASLEESDERIQLLYGIIIPQATQSLNSAISGYQVNKIDFLTLLNNLLTIFNFELDYYRLLTTYKKDASNLEYIIGRPLTNQN